MALLIFILPLALVGSSIYFHYNQLIEADFFCRELKFEAADLEDLSFDRQDLSAFLPALSFQYLPDSGPLEELKSSSLVFHSSSENFSILRC